MDGNQTLLSELEAMGFSKAQARKALSSGSHFSEIVQQEFQLQNPSRKIHLLEGNSNIEAAINWMIDHANDAEINEPLVPIDINIETSLPLHLSEQVKLRAHALRNQAHKKKAEQQKKREREREKERIRAGKELLEAKRMAEESERKRFLAQQKAEKEEERRAREKIRQKLDQDKLERRVLGLSRDGYLPVNSATILPQHTKCSDSTLLPAKGAAERESIRDCLRSLKRRNKEDEANTRRAFQTLLIYVKNLVSSPDEEKFRKIRISNPAFQERVGRYEEGTKFLELCGFERVDGGKYLFLPREMVDTSLLKLAGTELQNALTNPFFGLLSRST